MNHNFTRSLKILSKREYNLLKGLNIFFNFIKANNNFNKASNNLTPPVFLFYDRDSITGPFPPDTAPPSGR